MARHGTRICQRLRGHQQRHIIGDHQRQPGRRIISGPAAYRPLRPSECREAPRCARASAQPPLPPECQARRGRSRADGVPNGWRAHPDHDTSGHCRRTSQRSHMGIAPRGPQTLRPACGYADRVVDCCPIPRSAVTFGRRHHRQRVQRKSRLHRAAPSLPGAIPNGMRWPRLAVLIKVGTVLEPAGEAVRTFRDLQHQVEFCRPRLQRNHRYGQARQFQGASRCRALKHEHRLKDRVMMHLPFGCDRIDHLLERHVLVVMRGERRRPHLLEKCAQGRQARQVEPQCQGVGEQSQQRFAIPAAHDLRPANRRPRRPGRSAG